MNASDRLSTLASAMPCLIWLDEGGSSLLGLLRRIEVLHATGVEVAEPELHGFGGLIEAAAEEGGVLDEESCYCCWLLFTPQVWYLLFQLFSPASHLVHCWVEEHWVYTGCLVGQG